MNESADEDSLHQSTFQEMDEFRIGHAKSKLTDMDNRLQHSEDLRNMRSVLNKNTKLFQSAMNSSSA